MPGFDFVYLSITFTWLSWTYPGNDKPWSQFTATCLLPCWRLLSARQQAHAATLEAAQHAGTRIQRPPTGVRRFAAKPASPAGATCACR